MATPTTRFELEDVIIDNAVPIPAEDRVEATD